MHAITIGVDVVILFPFLPESLIIFNDCHANRSHPFLPLILTLAREYKPSFTVIPFILSI